MPRQHFWARFSFVREAAAHAFLNAAMPLAVMSVGSLLAHRPELRAYAWTVVAPWSAIAAVIVIGLWAVYGRTRGAAPPWLAIPGFALATAAGAAILSSVWFGVGSGDWVAGAIHGAPAGLLSGAISSVVIVIQARSAARKEIA